MRAKILGSAVVALVLSASAYAAPMPLVTFELTDEGGIGERNINFGGTAQGPSLTITGHVVPVPVNGQAVDFTSTLAEGDLWASGGQSDVDACTNTHIACPNGLITSVTITMPGKEFSDLILDPQKLTKDNSLELSVLTNASPTPVTFGPYGKHMNGNNFVTIEAAAGVEIISVTLTDSSGFEDLKQPRISGTGIVPVPESSSMILLGSGALGLAGVIRRKLTS